MPDDAPRFLVAPEQVRRAFVFGGVGLVALVLGVLLLATARPQGSFVTVDDSQHQARLQAAEAALSGFELVGDGARIGIGHAMQLVVERGVDQPVFAGGVPPVVAAPPDDEVLAQAPDVDGAALYTQHCMACHQATGAGVPGAFPPVANHVGLLVTADRAYPAKLILFGMMGPIEVQDMTYNGVMPGLAAALSDADVAGIMNHVMTAWDDVELLEDEFEPYTAEEVAEWRGLGLSMTDVHALRLELELP